MNRTERIAKVSENTGLGKKDAAAFQAGKEFRAKVYG